MSILYILTFHILLVHIDESLLPDFHGGMIIECIGLHVKGYQGSRSTGIDQYH